jgi:hypothetical protein
MISATSLWREKSSTRPAVTAPMNVDMDVPVRGFARGRDTTSSPNIAKLNGVFLLGDGLMELVMAFALALVANMQMTSDVRLAGKVMKCEFPSLLAAANMRISWLQALRISYSIPSCGWLKPDARVMISIFHTVRAYSIA